MTTTTLTALVRTGAVASILLASGLSEKATADESYSGCADHCYGAYPGEQPPPYGCISYLGGSNPWGCESDGARCTIDTNILCQIF